MRRGTTAAGAAALALLLALLAGCSSSSGSTASYNPAPRSFISAQYEYTNGTYRSPKPPATVAGEIAAEAAPGDEVDRRGRKYLRYQGTIVAISRGLQGGSRIDIESYRRGHQRWHSDIGAVWPSPDSGRSGDGAGSSGFRSGGAGSGGK